ncbi:MAG: DUF3043 domain-containing protein [Micromonosporaceae bacterium]
MPPAHARGGGLESAAAPAPGLDYPHHVRSLFHRRSQTDDQSAADAALDEPAAAAGGTPADAAPAESADHSGDTAPRAGVRPRARTPGKGKPTPKRRDQRRRTAEPPPKDRKEAYRRMRERQRVERAEAREAVMKGDDRYLPQRDRGPERALTRNIVDARRNVGTWFFGGAVVILIGTWPTVPPQIRAAFDAVWVVLLIAVTLDSVRLTRLVKRLVKERHPQTRKFGGLYFYAIMRSLTLRRMRIPKPQVSVGDKI